MLQMHSNAGKQGTKRIWHPFSTLCEKAWKRLVSIGFSSVLELAKAGGKAGLDVDGRVAVGGHCHSADTGFAVETGLLLSLSPLDRCHQLYLGLVQLNKFYYNPSKWLYEDRITSG